MLEGLHHWKVILILASIKLIGSFLEIILLDYLAAVLAVEYALVNYIHFKNENQSQN